MEQADFGYNDLPARTLEWENRFIDKTLEIQQKYPSYSFTLDAAANLESYLATRKDEKAKQLLGHLQTGKWGINALYANFFTGLSTPEELFRMLEFSLEAGRKYSLQLDSASQTDEPSLTWALAADSLRCRHQIFHQWQRPDPRRVQSHRTPEFSFAVLLGRPDRIQSPDVERNFLHRGRRHDLGRLEPRLSASGNIRDLGVRTDQVAAAFSFAIRAR